MKTNEWKREFYTFGTILFILFQGYKCLKNFRTKIFEFSNFELFQELKNLKFLMKIFQNTKIKTIRSGTTCSS